MACHVRKGEWQLRTFFVLPTVADMVGHVPTKLSFEVIRQWIRVNLFRDAIKSALTRWSQVLIPELGMENALVFDEKTDNYVYIYTGWKGGRHINATIAHIGIRDGKIHVFYDGIEASMVPDLLKAGILENEIVIERHPPFARHLTPFAIA